MSEEPLYCVQTDFGGVYPRLNKDEAGQKERELKKNGKTAQIVPMNEAARENEWPGYKKLKK